MKIPKKFWSSLISGSDQKILQAVPVLTGAPRHILHVWSLSHTPGSGRNILILEGSHSREKIMRHLLLRALREKISREERELLTLLGATAPVVWFLLIDYLLRRVESIKNQKRVKLFLAGLSQFPTFSFDLSRRYLKSFSPTIYFNRTWIPPRKRITPPNLIGVGYKDHGSLRPGPPIEIGSNLEEFGSIPQEFDEIQIFLGIFDTLLLSQDPTLLESVAPLSEEAQRGRKRS